MTLFSIAGTMPLDSRKSCMVAIETAVGRSVVGESAMVDCGVDAARARQLGRLENVAGYDLQARNKDEEDHRCRAPRFRDDDRGDESRKVVEGKPHHRLTDHAGVLQHAVEIAPLGEGCEPQESRGE